MAKRDKKKIIKVAVVGNGKTLRGLGPNMAAINLALHGCVDPDMQPYNAKEMWEVAYPKMRRGNDFGQVIIFGNGGGSEYFKNIWENSFKGHSLNNVFIPSCGPSMIQQMHDSIDRGDYLSKEEMIHRMGMRHIPSSPMLGYLSKHPLTPEDAFEPRPRRIGYSHVQKGMNDFFEGQEARTIINFNNPMARLSAANKVEDTINYNEDYIKSIAIACHYANKLICEANGDYSQVGWNDSPQWQRDSAVLGVTHRLNNPDGPASASHDSWLAEKNKEGWIYGEVKNPETKEHPCMVPYDQLPEFQKDKDKMFCQVLDLLSGKSCRDNQMKSDSAKIDITADREKTFGEKAVGVNFNPSQRGDVDHVKEMFAGLIDMSEAPVMQTRLGAVIKTNALVKCLDAQMAVVKLITFKE